MKWLVDEMVSWWNGKLMKWQVDEMRSWRNGKLMKQQVGKHQDDKIASWWKDNLTKNYRDRMTSRYNASRWNGTAPFIVFIYIEKQTNFWWKWLEVQECKFFNRIAFTGDFQFSLGKKNLRPKKKKKYSKFKNSPAPPLFYNLFAEYLKTFIQPGANFINIYERKLRFNKNTTAYIWFVYG